MALAPASFQLGTVSGVGLPYIVGVVDDFYPIARLKQAYTEGVRVLELRLDLFDHVSLDKVLAYFREIRELSIFGIIGTVRETAYNVWIRYRLFETLMPFVDGIDIEMGTSLRSELLGLARSENKKIILSEHYFLDTPSDQELDKLWHEAATFSPDLIKVAAMALTPKDVLRLLSFCVKYEQIPLSIMSMGELGQSTRFFGGVFGSVLTYGYLGDKAVAPGQVSVSKLGQVLTALK